MKPIDHYEAAEMRLLEGQSRLAKELAENPDLDPLEQDEILRPYAHLAEVHASLAAVGLHAAELLAHEPSILGGSTDQRRWYEVLGMP